MTETQGFTASGWEEVRDAFQANFDTGAEVGAAFSAYHRGEKVVDLWGGVADRDTGAEWVEDTLIPVFSTTKGATAMCANRLAEQGRLDVEALVTDYWPEFGQNGKENVRVQHLLSHQSGLAWIDGTMSLADALAWEPVIRALEAQAPSWEPGTQHGYHATTFGWLVGEVVKRISGQSLGSYFRDEIASPLGLDFWIGLPESEEHRVGTLISMIPTGPDPADDVDPSTLTDEERAAREQAAATAQMIRAGIEAFLGPDTMLGRALYAPGGAFADQDAWNTRAVHAAEVPAANGICDARSLARLYASCVSEVDGVRTLSADQMRAAIVPRTHGPNVVLMDLEVEFGLGFMIHAGIIPMGGPNSFGHFGAGGSVGWADPDNELAVGYVMNKMDLGVTGDARSSTLVDACYRAAG